MEPVLPEASIASTGLELRYIGGKYWSGLSGSVSVTDAEGDLLNFTSPNEPLVADARFFFITESGDDIMFRAYLNDLLILAIATQSTSVIYQNAASFGIPPLSKVKITGDNLSSSSGIAVSAILVARSVYR